MEVANLADVFRLSPLQQEMLSQRLQQTKGDAEVAQLGLALSGPLSPPLLQQAWNRVAAEQPVLRTSLYWEGLREPFQLVHRKLEPAIEVLDWRGRETEVPRFLAEDRARRLQPAKAPLFRLSLLQTGPEEHVLAWTFLRLLLDIPSALRLAGQALDAYEALVRGESPALERFRPFRDYVEWGRQRDAAAAERFWRQELAGVCAESSVGSGPPLPGRGGSHRHTARLTPEVSEALRALGRDRELQIPLETLVQGAWALVLRQGQPAAADDVLLGVEVAGRPAALPGAEAILGPFRNTLPLRVKVEPEAPLLAWLGRLQERLAAAQEHAQVPLSQIQAWCGTPRLLSQCAAEPEPFERAGSVRAREIACFEPALAPLRLTVRPGGGIALELSYDRGRFEAAETALAMERLAGLLESFAADPHRRLADFAIASPWGRAEAPAAAGPAQEGPEIRGAESAGAAWSEILTVPRDRPLPATFYQEWALRLDRAETNSIPSALAIDGPLDLAALRRALAEVVRRHESLRTSFAWEGSEARLVIAPPGEAPLPVIDLAALPEARRTAVLQGLIDEQGTLAFDLARGPLFTARAARLGEERHALLLNIHHVISDGWSVQILQRELFLLYKAMSESPSEKRAESPLPPLPIQAADFAHWQRRIYAGASLAAQLAWWRRNLADLPGPPALPNDKPRPETVGMRAVRADLEIGAGPTRALRELAQASRCSLSMVLLAAVDVLLHTYSGQEDLIVSSIFAARNRRELAGVIGLFMNTVPVRVDLSGNPSFRGLIGRVRDAMVEAYAHQDVPFPRVLAELFPGRKLTRTILTGVVFNMLSFSKVGGAPLSGIAAREGGLALRPLAGSGEITKNDLVFTGQEAENGVWFNVLGAADLFGPERLREVARRFEALLAQVAADPDVRLDRLRGLIQGQ